MPHNQTKHDILVVDDNQINLQILRDLLKSNGYKVRLAINGKQALSCVKEKEPDLIILDINMPEINGFEVCKILMKSGNHKHLPIIFLSALTDSFNKSLAFEAGGVDYLTKPLDFDVVLARVKTHISLRQLCEENERLKKLLGEKEDIIINMKVLKPNGG